MMSVYFRCAYLVVVAFILSGCQETSSFNELQEKAVTCASNKQLSSKCQKIISEYKLIYKQAMKLKSSPQAFGQKILGLQLEITQIKNTLLDTKDSTPQKAKLLKTLQQRQQQLKNYIKVVSFFESPS